MDIFVSSSIKSIRKPYTKVFECPGLLGTSLIHSTLQLYDKNDENVPINVVAEDDKEPFSSIIPLIENKFPQLCRPTRKNLLYQFFCCIQKTILSSYILSCPTQD